MWIEVSKDYSIVKKIGKGSFGIVVEAKCRTTGTSVAIKMIKDFAQYDYECVKLIREIQIMKQIQSSARNGHCSFVPYLLDLILTEEDGKDDS